MLERWGVSGFGSLGCAVVGLPSCQHAGSQDHLGWQFIENSPWLAGSVAIGPGLSLNLVCSKEVVECVEEGSHPSTLESLMLCCTSRVNITSECYGTAH